MDFNIKLSNGQVLKGMIKSPGENAKQLLFWFTGLESIFSAMLTGQICSIKKDRIYRS